jgi:amidohydrolase
MAGEDLKQAACALIDDIADQLIAASHRIHAHPELNFAEFIAHETLTGILEDRGLPVERSAYGIDTAFDCAVGEGGPTIAVLCEYDALPGIGHACGHNVIATAGLGAGIAAAALANEAGGRVRVMGTPAEEGGGGKIAMARQGAFDTVDASMMVHPADADLVRMDCVALQELTISYQGKAAHAAAAPWEGRNALDAAVLGYMNVAALRQHIRPNERIHGVFRKGGDKANIVPAETSMEWIVRSGTIASLQPLKDRVLTCLESAAAACGCTADHQWHQHTYSDMIDNEPMVAAYAANALSLGRQLADPQTTGKRVVGSTDMGNVSYLVPSIHPMIQVAPDGVAIHTVEFAEWAGGERGDRAVLDGAKAMAMTVIDMWTDAALLERTKAAFATRPSGVDVL